jgi:hypothetical protein
MATPGQGGVHSSPVVPAHERARDVERPRLADPVVPADTRGLTPENGEPGGEKRGHGDGGGHQTGGGARAHPHGTPALREEERCGASWAAIVKAP